MIGKKKTAWLLAWVVFIILAMGKSWNRELMPHYLKT